MQNFSYLHWMGIASSAKEGTSAKDRPLPVLLGNTVSKYYGNAVLPILSFCARHRGHGHTQPIVRAIAVCEVNTNENKHMEAVPPYLQKVNMNKRTWPSVVQSCNLDTRAWKATKGPPRIPIYLQPHTLFIAVFA